MDMGAVDLHRVGIDGTDTGAQLLQNFQAHSHIGDLGDIFNTAHAVYQQCGGDDRDRGILGAADLHFAKQGLTALYNIFCQILTLSSR